MRHLIRAASQGSPGTVDRVEGQSSGQGKAPAATAARGILIKSRRWFMKVLAICHRIDEAFLKPAAATQPPAFQ
jgi:hypothetical protein